MKSTLAAEPRLIEVGFFPSWQDAVVRHADLGPNHHVTNSVICSWFDDGRYALLVRVLRPLLDPADVLALANVAIDFHAEIRFGEVPRIGTAILRLGGSSIAIGQGIFVGDRCAATATSVTVVAGGPERRARALTENERAALTPDFGR
jgi:acyl-CoA thioester hydrolase